VSQARRLYAGYYGRLVRQASFSLAKGAALPFVRREAVRSGSHAMAYPISTYAPWQADQEFGRAYRAVKRNTLVDIWRCYELWSLLGQLVEVPGAILEVGVWRGGSGALMALRAAALQMPEPVHLCDTWQGVVKTGPMDIYYRDGKHDDTSREIVERLLERLALTNVELHQGIFPDETGPEVTDSELRLCHIDVDVYQSAKDVLEWCWSRLSPGGVVLFDDYGFPACPGVRQLVDEQYGRSDRLVIHNLNGHAILVKR
jgi:O-methyltransferase